MLFRRHYFIDVTIAFQQYPILHPFPKVRTLHPSTPFPPGFGRLFLLVSEASFRPVKIRRLSCFWNDGSPSSIPPPPFLSFLHSCHNLLPSPVSLPYAVFRCVDLVFSPLGSAVSPLFYDRCCPRFSLVIAYLFFSGHSLRASGVSLIEFRSSLTGFPFFCFFFFAPPNESAAPSPLALAFPRQRSLQLLSFFCWLVPAG